MPRYYDRTRPTYPPNRPRGPRQPTWDDVERAYQRGRAPRRQRRGY